MQYQKQPTGCRQAGSGSACKSKMKTRVRSKRRSQQPAQRASELHSYVTAHAHPALFHSGAHREFDFFFFFQAEDGIRDDLVTGVQTCALPILPSKRSAASAF